MSNSCMDIFCIVRMRMHASNPLTLLQQKKLPGVYAVLTAKDIPGHNQMGPVIHDEPCLAEKEVLCVGHAIVLIAAENEELARAAAKLVVIEYDLLEPVLDIRTAIEKGTLLAPPRDAKRGC
ncbi:MAG: hypothetical protein IPG90_22075 [Bacteroidetes bacterium]|nr:hypothetical protein [Bacteroidota bacterium]